MSVPMAKTTTIVMGKRPVSAVGLLIMIACVVVGFTPTLPSLLLLFATTLLGGYYIKKNAEESYDGFVKLFGLFVAGVNFIVAGMLLLTPLPYIDKVSHAMLPLMVSMIIITLIKNNSNE